MKIILTGCTGFIGTEVLQQAIAHNYISHIFCITRRELPPHLLKSKKVTQSIHEDFEEWDATLINTLRNYTVEGCIWCLGRGSIGQFKDLEEAKKVNISYTTHAAEVFASRLATALSPSVPVNKQSYPFRFIFMSGWGAEQDPHRSLWMWSDSRKIKGSAEKGLFEIADHSDEIEGKRCFEVISLRPGSVLAKGDATTTLLTEAVVPAISVDKLARCAIKMVLQETIDPNKRVVENRDCLGDDWGMVNTLSIS